MTIKHRFNSFRYLWRTILQALCFQSLCHLDFIFTHFERNDSENGIPRAQLSHFPPWESEGSGGGPKVGTWQQSKKSPERTFLMLKQRGVASFMSSPFLLHITEISRFGGPEPYALVKSPPSGPNPLILPAHIPRSLRIDLYVRPFSSC